MSKNLKSMSEKLLFPHDSVRPVQKEMIDAVVQSIATRTPLVVHAPTGLGKTAATIAPAITYAKANKKTIFFLTARHTQHLIVLQTVKSIKEKFDIDAKAVSIVGKRNLCGQQGAATMRSDDFISYCKSLRDEGKCSFYTNARSEKSQPTMKSEQFVSVLGKRLPLGSEEILGEASAEELCPYEISLMLAETADVIVADYNYIFQKRIRESFLGKTGKQLKDCIIIVDEGHNLPSRLREQMTQRLTSIMLKRAIFEAKKHEFSEALDILIQLNDILNSLSKRLYPGQQRLVKKEEFLGALKAIKTAKNGQMETETMVSLLDIAAESIREEQRSSAIGGIVQFINEWAEGDEGYSRILGVKEHNNDQIIVLSRRCLDPSVAAKEVVDSAHTTILMSGTLMPTSMFRDILGFPESTIEKEFESPFPDNNRECLVVPGATTKFTHRSEAMFKNIAAMCSSITNIVPGCSAVFFPSYAIRDSVARYFVDESKKTVFQEERNSSKEEKQETLKRFASYKQAGAVLLGVAAGSFGEGIDLPGILKSVIVVGIPLEKPDLETKELIDYYEKKFGRGWDYGYILPAITKTLQNAGRCIRSETDRGVLVFIDDRYLYPHYARCFPRDWEPQVARNPKENVQDFFGTFG